MSMPVWNIDMVDELLMHRQFILLPPGIKISITDSQRLWDLDPEILYLLNYRIAGKTEEISNALLAEGYSDDEIANILDSAVTINNYRTVYLSAYLDEIKEYNRWITGALSANNADSTMKLFDIMLHVNPNVTERDFNAPPKKERIKKQPKQGKGLYRATGVSVSNRPAIEFVRKKKPGKALQERIDELEAGKVLDVSTMKPDGTGARAQKLTQSKTKFGHESLPIISNNYETYLLAVNMLPGGERAHSEALSYMQKIFSSGSPKQSPKPLLPQPKIVIPTSGKPIAGVQLNVPKSPIKIVIPTSGKPVTGGQLNVPKSPIKVAIPTYGKPVTGGQLNVPKSQVKISIPVAPTASKSFFIPPTNLTALSNQKTIKDVSNLKIPSFAETGSLTDYQEIYDNVDIFDFDTYKKEYDMLSEYFSGLDLYLRTALLIDYTYNYLSENNRHLVEDSINQKHSHSEKLSYLTDLLDAFEPKYILIQWYRHHLPEKLKTDPGVVDRLLSKYGDHVDVLLNRMYKKHVDSDWTITPLWFSPNSEWYQTHTL